MTKIFKMLKYQLSARGPIALAFLCLALSPHVSAKFIAVSVLSQDNFRNLITEQIEKAVDEYMDDVYIDFAGGDVEYQLKQVQRYVDAGADAIIVLPGGDKKINQQLIELSKKVPIIFVNSTPIDDLTQLPPTSVYVGSKETDAGTMQMEELAKLAGYKGKVALLIGETSHPAAIQRTQVVKDVVGKYPNITLVKEQSGNWSRNQGYSIVKKWLEEGVDFQMLVANNDEMVIGGIMAIKDAGKDVKSYLTGGIDATKDAQSEMEKGTLDVTVLQDAEGQAYAAVEVAYQLINKERVDHAIWVPFRLVTPDNLSDFQ